MIKLRNIILCLSFTLLTFPIFGQDSLNVHFKKNIIKSFVFAFPFVAVATIGYERYISPRSSFSLTYNGYGKSEDGPSSSSNSLILAYNYNFRFKFRFINNIWISAYPIITKGEFDDDYLHYKTKGYGMGISTGKRMYINKNKRLFFDLGFGMSYVHEIYTKYWEEIFLLNTTTQQHYTIIIKNHKPYNYWMPRPILLIGYKF